MFRELFARRKPGLLSGVVAPDLSNGECSVCVDCRREMVAADKGGAFCRLGVFGAVDNVEAKVGDEIAV